MNNSKNFKKDLLNVMRELNPGGLWDCVESTFDRMEIAEDEITKAQTRHPDHADRIWGAFKLLCTSQLSGYPDVLYRAHCAEILDRVANGVDTRLGTKAEVMVALSQASLEYPPNRAALSLYARLFSEIHPGKADWVRCILDPSVWVNLKESQELLGALRNEARVDTRILGGE